MKKFALFTAPCVKVKPLRTFLSFSPILITVVSSFPIGRFWLPQNLVHDTKELVTIKNDEGLLMFSKSATLPNKSPRLSGKRNDFEDVLTSSSSLSRRDFVSSVLISASVVTTKPAVARTLDGKGLGSMVGAAATASETSQRALAPIPQGSGRRETFQEAVSGFVAGGALTTTKTLVKYPLDTASVRLQMPSTAYSLLDLPALFEGSFRGISTPLLSNIPAGAVFFAVKDATKSFLKGQLQQQQQQQQPTGTLPLPIPRWAITSLAVAVAQPPYWLLRNPSEVVKTRQQAGLDGYGDGVSGWDAFRRVYESGGDSERAENGTAVWNKIQPFYTGYWENMIYAYPADVIKFVVYDSFTKGRSNLSPLEGAVSGAFATAIAQFLTTPLDVVRNRVMMKTDDTSTAAEDILGIAKEEGLSGLFAGATPRVGKAILSGAIQFATYEETKTSITNFFKNK